MYNATHKCQKIEARVILFRRTRRRRVRYYPVSSLGVSESSERGRGERREDGWDGGAAGRHGVALHLRARRGEHQQLLGQPARHLLRAAAWGLFLLPNSVPFCCSDGVMVS